MLIGSRLEGDEKEQMTLSIVLSPFSRSPADRSRRAGEIVAEVAAVTVLSTFLLLLHIFREDLELTSVPDKKRERERRKWRETWATLQFQQPALSCEH